jgi:SAM-dependent methyltransferase
VAERGLLFETIAEDYDRVRPDYPPELVDLACAGLRPSSHVLEIGCGTGKLTRDLAGRGFRIDAVEPGEGMVVVARRTAPDATFHVARFEDVDLPEGAFDAAFSATAFHWVDPRVGWAKAARLLRPGGTFALFGHIADSTGPVHDELRAVWRDVHPDKPEWPPRTVDDLVDGARARAGNLSEAWAWLTSHELAVPQAAALFDDVRVATTPREVDETAEEVLEHIRTTSSYLQLDEGRRELIEQRHREIIDAAGGFRATIYGLLVTARAVPAGP